MHYLLIGAYDSDEPYRAVLAEYRQRVERVMLDFFNEFDLMWNYLLISLDYMLKLMLFQNRIWNNSSIETKFII